MMRGRLMKPTETIPRRPRAGQVLLLLGALVVVIAGLKAEIVTLVTCLSWNNPGRSHTEMLPDS